MILTWIIIAMTGFISYQAFNNTSMRQQLLFHPASIERTGQWHRFLTHGFIHANWGHLLMNMYVLYLFGSFAEGTFGVIYDPSVEVVFDEVEGMHFFQKTAEVSGGFNLGKVIYLLFYLSAIVVSSIPSYFKHRENNFYGALGASGATSALVFAYILFAPWQWFIFPPLPAAVFGVAYLWYSSYMAKRGTDNIGHDAHFWGAVYGLTFMLVSALIMKPKMLNFFMERLMEGPGGLPF